ncbi:hypothetical protein HOLleu_04934 [Holothuria leucospilota]|uniref:Testis-expressed sequence 264 protein n=1 Tax=Holothuria leucospilota TaxID=206669 RepID=A0A9Q1HIM0_HOLLE|nr:hypothetical protein HOLleu_04934 [Holothuria leucospilota]
MEDVIFLGIVGLVVALLLTILTLLWYTGVFSTVDVSSGKPPYGAMQIAYKYATGPYKECGPLFTELHNLVPDLKLCGVYYDDPNMVEHSKLRYIVAAILAEGDGEVDKDVVKKLQDKDYKFFELPDIDYAVKSLFPYVWDLSIYVAVMKVYPKMGKYIEERQLSAHPAVEVYECDTINFYMPLSKQESFYVPEAKQEESPEVAEEEGKKSGDDSTKGSNDEAKESKPKDGGKKNESGGEDSSSSFEQLDAPK